jgi:hypothetical protein
MMTGLEVQMTEKVPLEIVSFFGIILSLGSARNKILYLYLLWSRIYIVAGSSCSQLVWMKQMLEEYDVKQGVRTLYCDNLSAINISKNPIQHSRTKHIDIRHHFIRDFVEEKIVTLEHVSTEEQLADIFTKALDVKQFEKLKSKLGICLHEEL